MRITKSILLPFLSILFVVPFSGGCKKDNPKTADGENDFQIVYSIHFRTSGKNINGEDKAYFSSIKHEYTDVSEIKYSQYAFLPEEHKKLTPRIYDTELNRDAFLPQEALTYPSTEYTFRYFDYDPNRYLYELKSYIAPNNRLYYKYRYAYSYYNFIWVQVIDPHTLVVRTNESDTTYTVTQYNIAYFSNLEQ